MRWSQLCSTVWYSLVVEEVVTIIISKYCPCVGWYSSVRCGFNSIVQYDMVTITITIVVSSYYISFRADAALLVKPNHNHLDCHQP